MKAAAHFVGGAGEVVARAVASEAPAVMICGASFMLAELESRPLKARLLAPRRDLSCPLAEAVTEAQWQQARRDCPEALLAVDMKVPPAWRAQADLYLSPATAAQKLAAVAGRKLIMLPGAQIAEWLGYGAQVLSRWPRAVCQVHELATEEDLLQAQSLHPQAETVVHYLTRPQVRARADFVGDSAMIRRHCAESEKREFIVISEAGLAEYLAETMPDKRFYESEAEIFCPNMKLTTLKTMLECLESYLAERR